jgi:hypothetical protein
MTEMPGTNNAFLSPNLQEKYNKILDTKIDEISNQYHYMRVSSINSIMMIGFELGIAMCVEMMSENELKDKYL